MRRLQLALAALAACGFPLASRADGPLACPQAVDLALSRAPAGLAVKDREPGSFVLEGGEGPDKFAVMFVCAKRGRPTNQVGGFQSNSARANRAMATAIAELGAALTSSDPRGIGAKIRELSEDVAVGPDEPVAERYAFVGNAKVGCAGDVHARFCGVSDRRLSPD